MLSQQKGIDAEVLNAGMIAQDSGGVRRIAMEVLQYKPTGLILYLGNNEGIGMVLECKENNFPGYQRFATVFDSREYIESFLTSYSCSATFLQATSDTQWNKTNGVGTNDTNTMAAADQPLFEDDHPTDSVYLALQKRLKQNLQSIVNAANDVGTKVYIITTVPHLDYPPFYDANPPNLVEKDIQAIHKESVGQNSLKTKEMARYGKRLYWKHFPMKPIYASGYYLLGTALERQKYPQSWEARNKALLLDISRKRSLPVYADIARPFVMKMLVSRNLYIPISKKKPRGKHECISSVVRRSRASEPKGIDVVSRVCKNDDRKISLFFVFKRY